MSIELRRFIIDPEMDDDVKRLGIILNRLVARDRGESPGRIWLLDDDGDERAMSGSQGILPGDVLSANNYPFWARSAAGNHGRFTHSSGTPDIATFQDAGATIPVIAGNTRFANNVDVDGTFNADGAATFNATVTLGDAGGDTVTINGNTTVVNTFATQGATTLGNAAGDVITVTGTMTVAEILTLTKGLVVDTTTLVVDAVNDKVGVLTASPTAPLTVNGRIQVTENTVPSAGVGLELGFHTGSSTAVILAYDRTGAAYQSLQLDALATRLTISGTTRFQVDGTGMGFFNTTPVAKQTVNGTRTGTLGQLQTVVANMLTALANYGLWTDSTS